MARGKQLQITVARDKKQHAKHIVSHPDTNKQTLISGARWEKSATLYVRNISRDDRSDEEVSKNMKQCARMGSVRFLQVTVVKNRFCDDIAIDFWPDDVTCQEWRRWDGYRGQ